MLQRYAPSRSCAATSLTSGLAGLGTRHQGLGMQGLMLLLRWESLTLLLMLLRLSLLLGVQVLLLLLELLLVLLLAVLGLRLRLQRRRRHCL